MMEKLNDLIQSRLLQAKALMLTDSQKAGEEWYLVACLKTLKDIMECGDCNTCGISKTCQYTPKLGQMVRYNCPFYKKAGDKNA